MDGHSPCPRIRKSFATRVRMKAISLLRDALVLERGEIPAYSRCRFFFGRLEHQERRGLALDRRRHGQRFRQRSGLTKAGRTICFMLLLVLLPACGGAAAATETSARPTWVSLSDSNRERVADAFESSEVLQMYHLQATAELYEQGGLNHEMSFFLTAVGFCSLDRPDAKVSMAYHPSNMTISLLPAISEDGREMHWDHQSASASYVMDLDQAYWTGSSYMGETTGAFFSFAIEFSLAFHRENPRYQPFSVYEDYPGRAFLTASSCDEYVWALLSAAQERGVRLTPALMPQKHKIIIYSQTEPERIILEGGGGNGGADDKGDEDTSWSLPAPTRNDSSATDSWLSSSTYSAGSARQDDDAAEGDEDREGYDGSNNAATSASTGDASSGGSSNSSSDSGSRNDEGGSGSSENRRRGRRRANALRRAQQEEEEEVEERGVGGRWQDEKDGDVLDAWKERVAKASSVGLKSRSEAEPEADSDTPSDHVAYEDDASDVAVEEPGSGSSTMATATSATGYEGAEYAEYGDPDEEEAQPVDDWQQVVAYYQSLQLCLQERKFSFVTSLKDFAQYFDCLDDVAFIAIGPHEFYKVNLTSTKLDHVSRPEDLPAVVIQQRRFTWVDCLLAVSIVMILACGVHGMLWQGGVIEHLMIKHGYAQVQAADADAPRLERHPSLTRQMTTEYLRLGRRFLGKHDASASFESLENAVAAAAAAAAMASSTGVISRTPDGIVIGAEPPPGQTLQSERGRAEGGLPSSVDDEGPRRSVEQVDGRSNRNRSGCSGSRNNSSSSSGSDGQQLPRRRRKRSDAGRAKSLVYAHVGSDCEVDAEDSMEVDSATGHGGPWLGSRLRPRNATAPAAAADAMAPGTGGDQEGIEMKSVRAWSTRRVRDLAGVTGAERGVDDLEAAPPRMQGRRRPQRYRRVPPLVPLHLSADAAATWGTNYRDGGRDRWIRFPDSPAAHSPPGDDDEVGNGSGAEDAGRRPGAAAGGKALATRARDTAAGTVISAGGGLRSVDGLDASGGGHVVTAELGTRWSGDIGEFVGNVRPNSGSGSGSSSGRDGRGELSVPARPSSR